MVLAVVALGWWLTSRGSGGPGAPLPVPGDRVPYVVEVLNATHIDGLARAVTLRLRREGLDVVGYGTADSVDLDSTLLLVRRGDSAAGLAVRHALGAGRVVLQPDPDLLLDVSVLLGRDAAPPLERDP